ncbi:cytochrome c-type biogenesis protein CcmH [Bradyrhizobium sp. LHD-71]|uniref:cytochrome c-type biogenesis protein n=1 Tax=Bradyrhizobium sp. LHD-71 TaxID=3072141 RepID=UPI00280C51AC|nr:cytochrome c-type biogenesis protein CcmH [Bradyrhizobium sp. LHD-71]MDQ8728580.1 cytochrome c-type biogenesis protein CcmH [Bradyrhizobium sp. LHD-71]
MSFRRAVQHLLVAALVVCGSHALAVQPDEVMRDPAQEARARALSRELRCMVCQNQSIDDSDAPLARDLRLLVRERIGAGDTDAQVIDFLVARYGAFVLLKPRFEAQTLVLWLLPPLVLGIGAILLLVGARRRHAKGDRTGEAAPLSSEEQKQLEELLGNKDLSASSGAAPDGRAESGAITKV